MLGRGFSCCRLKCVCYVQRSCVSSPSSSPMMCEPWLREQCPLKTSQRAGWPQPTPVSRPGPAALRVTLPPCCTVAFSLSTLTDAVLPSGQKAFQGAPCTLWLSVSALACAMVLKFWFYKTALSPMGSTNPRALGSGAVFHAAPCPHPLHLWLRLVGEGETLAGKGVDDPVY